MKIHPIALLAALTSSTAFAQLYTDPSGNVGVGTTSPGAKLDVMGNIHTPHAGIFGDGHWNTENINYEALSTYGGATIRGNTMVVGKFSIGTWTQSAPPNGLFVAGVSIFDGNVGIGTASPLAGLEISRPSSAQASNLALSVGPGASSVGDGPSISFLHSGNERGYRIYERAIATHRGELRFASGNSTAGYDDRVVFDINGNVGIGTTFPSTKLHVAGNVTSHQQIINTGSQANVYVAYTNNGSSRWSTSLGTSEVGGNTGSDFQFSNYNDSGVQISVPLTIVRSNGNVGIGTTNPAHKLAVNGTIKAKEVIVETTGWSDYVFADGYRLAPLSEVEAHIKTNKHLPGIPSAAQVAETGVNLGDVQSALLAKVEELTLHLIAQEKHFAAQQQHLAAQQAQLTAQQQAMQSLQRENSALQTRLQQLEAR